MKVSTVGKMILSVKFFGVCDSCGKTFEFTLNDDTYIYIPTGRVRGKCPHCGQEHDTSLKIEKVEEPK